MKKLMVILGVLISSMAYGQCTTKQPTVMYHDTGRFVATARVFEVNPVQGFSMMKADVQNGDAMMINEGTSVSMVEILSPILCIVKVNGIALICFVDHLRCRQ